MNVIIVGCGRVGAELALLQSRRGHEVTVIDHVGSSFSHLDPAYRGRTIEAEPLAEGVLEKAGIRQARALASVTNSDPVNAVVAHVARTVYGVPNVVARNYDPRWLVLHEAMGLLAVSSTAWGAQRTSELLERPGLRAVFSAGNGEVELYEVAVPEAWSGRTLGALVDGLPCAPVSLTHGGRARLPEGALELAAGDVVHVTATLEGADLLARRLEAEGPGR
ncbi:MAG TPA: NAD-binding protein [Vicinamibacteria bacterium]|nr:NAD-binding protein [Vicinamibacteria bacterium]